MLMKLPSLIRSSDEEYPETLGKSKGLAQRSCFADPPGAVPVILTPHRSGANSKIATRSPDDQEARLNFSP
jgi:hypothetical protein